MVVLAYQRFSLYNQWNLQAVGDAFNEGLYEEHARLKGIPSLESRPKNLMRKMTAKEACGNQKVSYLTRVVKVADVEAILRTNNHNGFPVVDHSRGGEMMVIGLILRSHLLVLLQSKADFQHSPLAVDMRSQSIPIRYYMNENLKSAFVSAPADPTVDLNMQLSLAMILTTKNCQEIPSMKDKFRRGEVVLK